MSQFRPIKNTNNKGAENLLQISGFDYIHYFGINDNGYLKPFTTDTSVTGVPAYIASYADVGQAVIQNSGAGATSSGLNPYGLNTVHEGLFWGTGYLVDNDAQIPDFRTVRSYGFKNPMQVVGWGFDIFGYPVPNLNPDADGVNANYVSGIFPEDSYLGISGNPGTAGWAVPLNNFKAGPLDLRWDAHRGVWCGWHGGVQAGLIVGTSSGITPLSQPVEEPYFSESIFYDVLINDGIASSILITGVAHIGPKPQDGLYRIMPYSSGDFCFIVNKDNKYQVWLIELPGTEQCDEPDPLALSVSSDLLPTGITGTLLIDSNDDGNVEGYMVFVSGILMFASGNGNHVSFNVGSTGYDGGF